MNGNIPFVIRDAAVTAGLVIIAAVVQIWGDRIIRRKTALSRNACRTKFVKCLLQNPLHRLYMAKHGELIKNLNDDMNACVARFAENWPDILAGAFTTLGYVLFLSLQSVPVAVVLLAIALLQILPPVIVKKFMQVNYDECCEIEETITDHIVQAVDGFDTIKLYNLKDWWLDKLSVYHKKYLRVGHKTDTVAAAQRSMYSILDNILKFGTYALLGIFVLLNQCSVSVAVQAIYLSGGLFAAVKTLSTAIPALAVAGVAQNRLNKWIPDEGNSNNVKGGGTTISFQQLSFPSPEKTLYENLSVDFSADRNYRIAGENGSGKSTLFNLILGTVLPQEGRVFIGQDTPGQADLKTIFYVPQNDPAYNFDAVTLYSMFHPAIQQQAMKLADQFGLQNEQLQDCPLTELSGGERKKVFLSLGFAVGAQWLLLDEPTNNLDAQGKVVLHTLIASRTGVLVISHDTNIDKTVDCRLRLEEGRIIYEK